MAAAMDDQLNWKDYLDPAHYDISLHALRYSACRRLALHLDEQDIVIHNGMVPNFGGLAELVGFDGLEINDMERAKSPTKQLLQEWTNRPDLQPTVGRLVEFLAQLGREDVLTDCQKMIHDDIKFFIERPQQFDKMKQAPIQDQTVSQGPGYEEIPIHVTRHDVLEGRETYYDAFICYNPYGDSSKDLEFVRELIKRFDGDESPYGFRLFVPYRDDLVGLNAHSINAKIISERCRHMIVVLSPNFLASPACEFQSTFAHALSPGARNKRIIPIKIQDCPTPNILRIMACCDFTKRDLWDWSWERLAKSIMVQLNSEDYQVSGSQRLDGLIRSSNFDLNSVMESGVSSMLSSPASTRSASPVPSPRSATQHIITRPTESPQPYLMEVSSQSNTVSIVSRKPKGGPLRNLFNMKSKTKGNTAVPDS